MFIAIDPGNEKTGMALLEESGKLVLKCIPPTPECAEQIRQWIDLYEVSNIVCGNGTNHKYLFKIIQQIGQEYNIPTQLVEEAHTTEEARRRYWEYNPPKGLKKLIPLGMQYPPVPVDDFTAWIIGERFIELQKADKK